jgi:hypothetical protein
MYLSLSFLVKQYVVDGISAPLPVIAMGIVGLVVSIISMYASEGFAQKLSMWYLLVISSLNAYTFLAAPEVPLRDSFPEAQVAPGSPGIVYCEVVGFHFVMLAASCFPGPFGLAMAMTSLLAGFAKHITVDKMNPPVPVMIMAGGVFLCCWYDVIIGSGHGDAKKVPKQSAYKKHR